MSLSLRIFFLDDDTIRRVPYRVYDEVYRTGSRRALPEYAGQVIRCAEVVVELQSRKPVGVMRIAYPLLVFDERGRLDQATRDAVMNLAAQSLYLPPIPPAADSEEIERTRRAASRQLKQEYYWSPSEVERTEIERLALLPR